MGGKDGRNSLCPRASLNISRGPAALPHGQVTAGPDPPRAAWGARSALPALTRGAGRPSPSSRASRPVRSRRVASRWVPLAGSDASRRQRGHFLTPGHCIGCPSLPVVGPAATRPQDAECD